MLWLHVRDLFAGTKQVLTPATRKTILLWFDIRQELLLMVAAISCDSKGYTEKTTIPVYAYSYLVRCELSISGECVNLGEARKERHIWSKTKSPASTMYAKT